jgi:hypothetical protein
MGLIIENKDLKGVLVVVFALSCMVLCHFAILLLLVGQALLGMPRWHCKLQKVVSGQCVADDDKELIPNTDSA